MCLILTRILQFQQRRLHCKAVRLPGPARPLLQDYQGRIEHDDGAIFSRA